MRPGVRDKLTFEPSDPRAARVRAGNASGCYPDRRLPAVSRRRSWRGAGVPMQTQPWPIPGLVIIVCLAAGNAAAQTAVPRFEVGGHFSTLRIGEAGNTNAGIGGRAGYDFSRWLAVEAETSFFPRDRIDVDMGVAPITTTRWSRRRLEGFFGPKVGVRGERLGAFAKVRAGF